MAKHNKMIILIGALLLLVGLMFLLEPYYTWAQEEQENNHPCRVAVEPDESLFELENMNPGDETTRTIKVIKTGTSSANLYMTWNFISGVPTLGQEGSLFEQLILVISYEGEELYRGPMINGPQTGTPSALTDSLYIAFMEHGKELELDFTVILPGPETGNVFQGSNLVTKIVFYTICDDEPDTTPAINIEKYTNGVDADVPTGPFILIGDPVTWTYVVTNPGRVPLSNVEVTDDIAGVNPVYVSGDINEDGILQVGETWIFEATGIAQAGQYANIGTVDGTPPEGEDVTDSDPSHYIGVSGIIVDLDDPGVEPEDPSADDDGDERDDSSTVIISPERPTQSPLPRTDGATLGILIGGFTILLIGLTLKRRELESN